MRWLTRLFRRSKLDAQLDSELRFHVERQTADNIAAGMSPAEARRRALAQFGGLESRKEEAREARGTHFIDALLQDIRFAFRLLRKTPLVTGIALLSLALGIGANTAIFSLVDAVILRMLPVQNPEQLMRIQFRSPRSGRLNQSVTNPIWEQVRDHQDGFSGVIAWSEDMFDLAFGGEENNINGIYASGNYFNVLGVRPAAGRLLSVSDDVRGCSATSTPVVIVNQLLARRYFNSQSAIGQHLLVGIPSSGTRAMLREPVEIIGVVQDAKYTSLAEVPMPEAYFPLSQIQQNVGEYTTFEIRTAVTPASLIPAARDAMASVSKLASLQFVTLKEQANDSVLQRHLMAVLSGFFGGLALLLTAIGLYGVMAYVVTLRTHEIGIRMALDAQRGSILRLVMRDAAIVLAAGIAAGLVIAWVMRFVEEILFGPMPNHPLTLALAVMVLFAVAVVATYIPARRAMKVEPMVALRYE